MEVQMAKSKKVIQKESVSGKKLPVAIEDPNSYYRMTPVQSFKYLDNGYKKWGFAHVETLNATVISKLKDYEGMMWGDIMQASGGRSHGNNSHFENVSELIPEAQQRWSELKFDEYDRVFSLRLTGEQRIYGILENGVLKIVWFDPIHEIYSVKK